MTDRPSGCRRWNWSWPRRVGCLPPLLAEVCARRLLALVPLHAFYAQPQPNRLWPRPPPAFTQVEHQVEALLARQAALQAERERLTRAMAVERRAPRADWTGAFPWVRCLGRLGTTLRVANRPCLCSALMHAGSTTPAGAGGQAGICLSHRSRPCSPALSAWKPAPCPAPCCLPTTQDATVQQLLGSVFALREFRPLQREVINATLQARPPVLLHSDPGHAWMANWRGRAFAVAVAACLAADCKSGGAGDILPARFPL